MAWDKPESAKLSGFALWSYSHLVPLFPPCSWESFIETIFFIDQIGFLSCFIKL